MSDLKTTDNCVKDIVICSARWDEIVNNLEGGYGMTDEEVEVVRSILKNNIPFCVVDDPIDHVISKEVQTHLDATHVGCTGNSALYYKSETLKKWFWWNEGCGWEDCAFGYDEDTSDLYSISISKSV